MTTSRVDALAAVERVTAPTEPGPSEMVVVALADVNGSLRGKALRPAAFERCVERGLPMTDLLLGLDPVDTPISAYESLGIRSGAGDLVLWPELPTLRPMRWRPGWQICLGRPRWQSGEPCRLASRELLLGVLDQLGHEGLAAQAALEYEVRVFGPGRQPLSGGISYSVGGLGPFGDLVDELVPALEALGIEVVALHTEAGPGLLELNIGAQSGVAAGDHAALAKLAVKGVAAGLGLQASFLAKPVQGEEGSSGHLHLSLWQHGANAFALAPGSRELAPTLRHAVAGLVAHLPAASLLYNPTLNSYKRLVPGWFAPVNASWGFDNRSAALRVIASERAEGGHLECRRPGADANPYLVLAGALASALDGLRRELALPPPVEGDAYARADLAELPASLESAIDAFEADASLRVVLGEEFCSYYAVSRKWELAAWQQTVTDWERARYEGAV